MSALVSLLAVIAVIFGLISCNDPARERQTPGNKENKITVYPHGPEFMSTHGEAFSKNSGQCFKCHGADLAGGSAKVSCRTCHGNTFPHPSHWAKPGGHGDAFAKSDEPSRKLCLSCHVDAATDSAPKAVSCFDCHKAYPHSELETKKFKNRHGELAMSFDGKCLSCHTNYIKHMPSDPETGCKSCHDGNLTIEWKEARQLKPGTRQPTNSPKPKK